MASIVAELRDAEYRNPGHMLYGHAAETLADIAKEATFLIDRLKEFECGVLDDDVGREYYGHVAPAVRRLEMLIEQVSA